MSEPICAKKGPYCEDLKEGTYWWCSCGKSQKQPFCDGSHRGTDFSPIKVEIEEARTVYLCGCKKAAKAPFCDGTHNKL